MPRLRPPILTTTLISALLLLGAAHATLPNTNEPTTALGPTARAAYTSTFNDTTAFSFAGELGFKNYRASGTFGWAIDDEQRAKVTLEYLWQDLTYSFSSGNTNQWVSQGALGITYQHDIPFNAYPRLGLNGYVSYAPNKSLGTTNGTFVNSLGVTQGFLDRRRIAGSTAFGVSPQFTMEPWLGTKTGIELNYDNVQYDKSYYPNRNAKGFGGTGRLDQALTSDISLNLLASVRQPFNNYQAGLTWANLPLVGQWLLGVEGAYTAGKNTLPNSYNILITGTYDLDRSGGVPQPLQQEREWDMRGDVTEVPHDSLASWTSDPAVYMPEVLAIPDQQLQTGCRYGTPVFVGAIPAQSTAGGPVTVNTATYFTGKNLTYTMVSNPTPGPGATLTLNSATGVLTASDLRQIINVTITATNPCGSAVSNTFTITPGP